jgi:O-antigen/teichoic acid export membrane protein
VLVGRSRRTVAASATAIAGRVAGSVFTLLSIPILTEHLGADGYGVWAAILALALVAATLDFGANAALTTPLSESLAVDDWEQAAALTWTTAALLVLVAAVGAVLTPLLFAVVPLARLTGIDDGPLRESVAPAGTVLVCLTLAALPLVVVERLLVSAQQGYLWSMWAFAANAASFAGIAAASLAGWSLPLTAVAYAAPPLLVYVVAAAVVFGRAYPALRPGRRHVAPRLMRSVIGRGALLLATQVAWLLAFNADVLVTASILDAEAAATYSVAWRLATWGPSLLGTGAALLWPAFVEARARGDIAWCRRAFAIAMGVSAALTAAGGIAFVFLGAWAVDVVAADVDTPPLSLRLALGLWGVMSVTSSVAYFLLVAFDRLVFQAWVSVVMAVVNLGLSIVFVSSVGVSGAAWGTIAAYLAVVAVPYAIAIRSCLR